MVIGLTRLLQRDADEPLDGRWKSGRIDAGAAAELTLERSPRGLRLAVQDAPLLRAPSLPRHQLTDPLRRGRGLGMEMLGNLTTAWGVDVASGGKIAWAVIADDARPT